jgi:hypothetical protein
MPLSFMSVHILVSAMYLDFTKKEGSSQGLSHFRHFFWISRWQNIPSSTKISRSKHWRLPICRVRYPRRTHLPHRVVGGTWGLVPLCIPNNTTRPWRCELRGYCGRGRSSRKVWSVFCHEFLSFTNEVRYQPHYVLLSLVDMPRSVELSRGFLPEHAVEILGYAAKHDYHNIVEEAVLHSVRLPLLQVFDELPTRFFRPWVSGSSSCVIRDLFDWWAIYIILIS